MNRRYFIFGLLAALSTTAFGCDSAIDKFDAIVVADETCNEKWSNIESQLQRRSDMIPQLVAVVKGSANHEKSTLEAVTQARASATRPEIKLDPNSDDFSNPEKVAAFQAAQSQLGTALGKLMVSHEAYPELKANQAFHDLQVQIEGTENRLLRAREEYNKAVKEYNTELRKVGGRVMSPVTNKEFKPRVFFSADASAHAAPTVDFSNPPASK